MKPPLFCRLSILMLMIMLIGASGTCLAAEVPTLAEIQKKEIKLLRARLVQAQREAQTEGVSRLVYETQIIVAAMRGFSVTEPVENAPMTRQTLSRIIDESIERQYPGQTLELYVWFNQLFGALPEGIDMASFLKDLMGEQAAGLYDQDSKLFYVREDYPLESAAGLMVLSHEITHALQDQNHSFKALGLEETGDDDRAMAVLAIAEGDATMLMGEYLVYTGKIMSFIFDLPQMLMMDQQQFNNAPQSIQQMMLFPYLEGMNFFQSLAGRTRQNPHRNVYQGESTAWRSEVFADPPETTEQIIHPEKYLARELPATIPALNEIEGIETAADARFENIMGEFGIQMVLGTTLNLERAKTAADGWNGDRVLVTANADGSRRAVRWVTRWDTAADAEEFSQALRDAFSERFGKRLKWKKDGSTLKGKIKKTGTLEIRSTSSDRVELVGIIAGPLE